MEPLGRIPSPTSSKAHRDDLRWAQVQGPDGKDRDTIRVEAAPHRDAEGKLVGVVVTLSEPIGHLSERTPRTCAIPRSEGVSEEVEFTRGSSYRPPRLADPPEPPTDVAHADSPETGKDRFLIEPEVHQIELEMQSEELSTASHVAEQLAWKYISLYDFAPAT